MKHVEVIAGTALLLIGAAASANETNSQQLPPTARYAQNTKAGKAGGTAAAAAPTANATLKTADGKDVGTVSLSQTPNGVRLRLALTGLPPGEHAFHVHAVGKCEPPGFTSAGPHFNPESKKHGKLNKEGHHAGDMDNINVPGNGKLNATVVDKDITLEKGKPNSVF